MKIPVYSESAFPPKPNDPTESDQELRQRIRSYFRDNDVSLENDTDFTLNLIKQERETAHALGYKHGVDAGDRAHELYRRAEALSLTDDGMDSDA